MPGTEESTSSAETATTETTSTTTDATTGATGTETEPETTDWKAMARKWEKTAKANTTAAAERDALKAKHMTEQEKAVAEAEARGKTTASADYGRRLAAAEFKAAVAAKGLDLGEALDLIDTSKFVGDDGEVDEAAIKTAVAKLAKLAKTTTGRLGADHSGGGTGTERPKSVHEALARKHNT